MTNKQKWLLLVISAAILSYGIHLIDHVQSLHEIDCSTIENLSKMVRSCRSISGAMRFLGIYVLLATVGACAIPAWAWSLQRKSI